VTNTLRFVCDLPTGLHARPASLIAEIARRHRAAVTIHNQFSSASADGRSVLSLIALDIQRGHEVLIEAVGDDAPVLLEAIDALVKSHFGEAIHAAPVAPSVESGEFTTSVPTALRRMNARIVRGRPVCPGTGDGIAVVAGARSSLAMYDDSAEAPASSPQSERSRLHAAIGAVRTEIEHDLGRLGSSGGVRAELLRAHLGIVDDPALIERIDASVNAGRGAPGAVVEAARHFAARLGASASAYIRERAADIEDVCRRILATLEGIEHGEAAPGEQSRINLARPSILIAESLGVSDLMALDRTHLRGLILGSVGPTSHVVILARSMMVPTLINVEAAARAIRPGTPTVVDAIGGFAVADASPDVSLYYQREAEARARRRARLAPLLSRRGRTRDNTPLEIAANAATPGEIAAAMQAGADSIGLLRTELLFLDRCDAPTEEEQLHIYRSAVEAANGREVIIRTLDIGGDKPAPYLALPREDNPFLGCRGLRLYEKFPELIRAQLRAICRASSHGPIKVMAPMVATLSEARWFGDRIAEVQADLAAAGIAHDPNMPIGIMVEVPAAAMILDQLAHAIDFISIGTNDLCQYWMSADRTNADVAALNNPHDPSFLRILHHTCLAAREHGLWAGLCGEMGSDPLHLPLMVGLGLNEISVGASALEPIKLRLAGLDADECRKLLNRAMKCETPAEVGALLCERGAGSTLALADASSPPDGPIHPDLVIADCEATTREQVIHELICALHGAGRTDDPRAVEEAVWAREAKGVTALGFGFAIPHGQTDAVGGPSIAVANLRAPVDWGGDEPVRGVVMLTVPASDAEKTHLKLLAKIARRLMHEPFREALLGAKRVEEIVAILRTELA
jgi:fructose-specific PTS system IIA-like component